MENRVKWAKGVMHWGMDDWSRIIWTDEASVELGRNSHPRKVIRKPGEGYLPDCLEPTFKSGRSSVMVWGSIAYNKKGPLIILPKGKLSSAEYVDFILSKPLLDFYMDLSEERGLVKVVEDGAPIHTAKFTQSFRDSHFLDSLYHPSQSPDLNPIEHVWHRLKSSLSKRGTIPKNTQELCSAILKE